MRHFRIIFLLSLLLALPSISDPLRESMSLKVRVVGKILEEKPALEPPLKLSPEGKADFIDLSGKLLKPPKYIEPADIQPPKSSGACGEPKDRVKFRAGVKYYLNGDLKRAESRFLDVLSIPKAVYIAPAQYMLGLIYSEIGNLKKAMDFFRRACEVPHQFRRASCEAYYAVSFKVNGDLPSDLENKFWKTVASIRTGKLGESVDCSDTVFKAYCNYVMSFLEGNEDEEYPHSTALRRAVVLMNKGNLKTAKSIFLNYSRPLKPYRDIAIYYLGVIAFKEGDKKEAYRRASFLETLNPQLAENLHTVISSGDVLFSRIAYNLTGNREILRTTAIHSYNEGHYEVAYREFLEAGDHFRAVWSALKWGNLELAKDALRGFEPVSEEEFRWTLEVLYWSGETKEIEEVLEKIKKKYPSLYREYRGWVYFRSEEWDRAFRYFSDPYHKALALYNAGKYGDVLKILKDSEGSKERVLKAKAAISLGRGSLARKFLKEEVPDELYLKGMSYFIEGKYDQAIEYFRKVKGEGDTGVRALLRIGDSYYNMNRYQEAREIYKQILKNYKDSPVAYDAVLALAQIEVQNPSQDLGELLKEFTQKFPDSPMIPDLKYQLAVYKIKRGGTEEAKDILYELMEIPSYRAIALLKLAEIEENPEEKEKKLREVIGIASGEVKDKATGMLMGLFVQRKEYEKLADFLVKGDFNDRKKALEIYIDKNLDKAVILFDDLYRERPGDEELKFYALKLYKKTKGRRYLRIASRSSNKRVKAEALYRLGKITAKKNRRKALEHFVEVIMSAEGIQPYYNNSIFEAVDILVKLKARRDASCLLAKLDRKSLTKRDRKRVKILKKKLPACQARK